MEECVQQYKKKIKQRKKITKKTEKTNQHKKQNKISLANIKKKTKQKREIQK